MASQATVRRWRDPYRHDDTGWISFGAFLIIVAAIYLTTPNIAYEVRAFLQDFQLVEIFPNFWWALPSSNHPVLYAAVERFCYVFGVVQIGILGLRFARGSSIRGKAQTFSSVVFWLGAGYIVSLLSQGILVPLSFLGAFVIVVGISILARALILVSVPQRLA
jgi:hypothetical protein